MHNDIAILDIEASGLHFDAYPIEIAFGYNNEVYSWLIRPLPQWQYWSTEAEAIHGISREQLEKEGLAPSEVIKALSKQIAKTNGVIYSDAYQWDCEWLQTLYLAHNERIDFHIAPIFDLMTPEQEIVFKTTKRELEKSHRFTAHRAKDDVQIIFESYNTATESS